MPVASKDFSEVCSPAALQDVFPFLSAEEIESFCPYLELREWEANEVIMRDGDPGEYMGFLIEGKLAVKKETTFPGKYILVAVIERGSMVGEISVVERGMRTATVVTMEKSRLLILAYEQMDKMLVQDSVLAVKLLRRVIHVLGYRLRKASERLSWLL